ncbi:TPA: DNA polymerase Y family protein, partial [Burkholderia territorii]|nr:DNA polymerase Y family protein [Burkholderia territorii]HDR9116141.1 DNA polymerase Y family protein [Burkholderia territorii]
MRVLLGIHLPRLPLDVCAPPPSDAAAGEASEAGDAGCAVLEQGVVLIADAPARRQGVRAGMKRGGVLTLAPDTRLVERDPAREADALRAVALALLRFSPCVALDDEATLIVDVGPSLRLFGGLPSLCRQVRATLAALG